MVDGIEVDIVDMPRQVFVIANQMFPKPSSPYPAFALAAAGAKIIRVRSSEFENCDLISRQRAG